MDEFKADVRKMDVYSEKIKDYGKQLKETQEGIASIRENLRHKLSAAEGIGKALRNIEENMETETAVMLGLGSSLEMIARNYRNSEQRILDFGTGSISGSQLSDLQREAWEYENTVGNGEKKELLVGVHNYCGSSAGGKLFKNTADGIVDGVRNSLTSAWNNTVGRSLENITASICDLLDIDYAKLNPNGPVAKILNYIDGLLRENEILSEITGTFEWPCDVIEAVSECLAEGPNGENLIKILKIFFPFLPWDKLPQSSFGSSGQGASCIIQI